MKRHGLIILTTAVALVCIGCRRTASPPEVVVEQVESSAELPVGSSPATIPTDQLDQVVSLLNRGIGLMDQEKPMEAAETFEQIVQLAPRWTTARVNLGIALLNAQGDANFARAEQQLNQAIAQDPRNPYAHYSLGMLLRHLARADEAQRHFERVLEIDPHDADAHFQLATIHSTSDPGVARRHLEATLARIPHHESACYRLQALLRRAGESELAAEYLARFQALKDSGAGVTYSMNYGQMGRYAGLVDSMDGLPPEQASQTVRPDFSDVAKSVGLVEATGGTAGVPGQGELRPEAFGPGVAVEDVDGDGDLDIYIPGVSREQTGTLYLNFADTFTVATDSGIDGRGAVGAYFGDYDGDGDLDLYLTCSGPNRLYRNDGTGRFVDATKFSGTGGGALLSIGATWGDADHDGDLDIYVANFSQLGHTDQGDFGAANALFRNNGDGTFTDLASEAGIDCGTVASVGALYFDADSDRDVDLFVVNHGAANQLFLNERIGRYSPAILSDTQLSDDGASLGALAGDVDGNRLGDILLLRSDGPPRLFLHLDRGQFVEDRRLASGLNDLNGANGALLGDFDLDGDLDLVLFDARGTTAGHYIVMNDGTGQFEAPYCFAPQEDSARSRGAVCADFDGDGALELLVARAGKPPQLWRAAIPAGRNWLKIAPSRTPPATTKKLAPHGIGLSVEVKTGTQSQVVGLYSAAGYLGSPATQAHFGLGPSSKVDYLRLTWPDGVLQSELEVAANQNRRFVKAQRKASSCPILFTWDGDRFAFVTDFLGVGGLGFFVAPGNYAAPDPTEDVRIPPEVIRPKDGRYLLRVAEPLEEVCYFDRLNLLAYDHPAEWDVYPDERFTSESPHVGGSIVAVRERIFPKRARDHHNRDVRDLILKVDRRRVEPDLDKRFVGYTEPHRVDLDFGTQLKQFSADDRLVVCLYGWTEYTYSHVNYAAHQAGLEMQPPQLEVLNDEGQWQVAIDDAGFPAGMPRMMTIDISSLPFVRTNGRLRLGSNMHICWDQIFVAKNEAGAEVKRHKLLPRVAQLRLLGYPREYSPDGYDPTLYDYQRLDTSVAFQNLSGSYTRFGDVRPLLEDVDDQFVIMGRGEEIVLEFAADALPELPVGNSRTLVLHADGYCKDMDLYTAFPDTVEPLPFHAMKNYPPEGSGPNGETYDRYQLEWNTRHVHGN